MRHAGRDQRALVGIAGEAPAGVVEIRNQYCSAHGMTFEQGGDLCRIDAETGAVRHFDHAQAERRDRLQQSVIGRRLQQDDIARACDGAQRQADRFHRAGGDDDFVGIDVDSALCIASCDMQAQFGEALRHRVAERGIRITTQGTRRRRDERSRRQQRERGRGGMQRQHVLAREHVEHAEQGRIADRLRRARMARSGKTAWRRRDGRSHVVPGSWSRLDQTFAFEVHVGLDRRRQAHPLLAAEPSQRRQALARAQYAALDLVAQAFGEAFVEEGAGHGICTGRIR